MGHRLSRIYTRTGDAGDTGLADGSRTSKAGARVRAMGEIDELNSFIGLLACQGDIDPALHGLLIDVQHALFNLGGELAIPGSEVIGPQDVAGLEGRIDKYNADLPPLKEFILPGGSQAAALCHVSRGVCRRAERALIALSDGDTVNPSSLQFLNRLSDLLFVIARRIARQDAGTEIMWEQGRGVK
jgi:cob(I)alamin adenosyltransferase